ncbi:MAG: class I SAM-dependent methyltransferase, partial [Chloroflexota bacterium]
PNRPVSILDVGCGNGVFARFMLKNKRLERYLGVDFSAGLLQAAEAYEVDRATAINFESRDISRAGFLADLPTFDLVACFAAMHHIPQKARRAFLLKEMGGHLKSGGLLFLSNWQFLNSERQKRKILSWDEVGLHPELVEANDYLLSWQRGGFGRRYVCLIGPEETDWMVAEAGLELVEQYYSDGKEKNLALYTILRKP